MRTLRQIAPVRFGPKAGSHLDETPFLEGFYRWEWGLGVDSYLIAMDGSAAVPIDWRNG